MGRDVSMQETQQPPAGADPAGLSSVTGAFRRPTPTQRGPKPRTPAALANSAAYLVPHLRPGLTLLDIGAGPGTITADLAALVSPGRVTAVEVTEQALRLARAEADARGVDNIDFVVADVHALDLPDDSFDVVHAHQVLQHVADPRRALAAMRRVRRPA